MFERPFVERIGLRKTPVLAQVAGVVVPTALTVVTAHVVGGFVDGYSKAHAKAKAEAAAQAEWAKRGRQLALEDQSGQGRYDTTAARAAMADADRFLDETGRYLEEAAAFAGQQARRRGAKPQQGESRKARRRREQREAEAEARADVVSVANARAALYKALGELRAAGLPKAEEDSQRAEILRELAALRR